jgi:hypothetical protein
MRRPNQDEIMPIITQLDPSINDDVNGVDMFQQGDVLLRPRGAKTFKSRPKILT